MHFNKVDVRIHFPQLREDCESTLLVYGFHMSRGGVGSPSAGGSVRGGSAARRAAHLRRLLPCQVLEQQHVRGEDVVHAHGARIPGA